MITTPSLRAINLLYHIIMSQAVFHLLRSYDFRVHGVNTKIARRAEWFYSIGISRSNKKGLLSDLCVSVVNKKLFYGFQLYRLS